MDISGIASLASLAGRRAVPWACHALAVQFGAVPGLARRRGRRIVQIPSNVPFLSFNGAGAEL
jgi:hypothetical protein